MSTAPPVGVSIRNAVQTDLDVIVDFNLRLAWETEAKRLDPARLRCGVSQALADSTRIHYWVAVRDLDGCVVGQAGATREWSDWRNGWFWWLQSVYVIADHRGQGLFKALYSKIREDAQDEGDVVGIRLYVENDNQKARSAYRSLGLKDVGYAVLEDAWPVQAGGAGDGHTPS